MEGKARKAFHFKQFDIYDDHSTMKVGTDAVLLGTWVDTVKESNDALDVGCGCGIIAMTIAQRFPEMNVLGLDIDSDSAAQSAENFNAHPASDRLKAINADFRRFAQESNMKFDLVVSNPPFFVNALKGQQEKRNKARHTDSLPFQYLAQGAAKVLKEDGLLAIILPTPEAELFLPIARRAGFSLIRRTDVVPKEGKDANRILMAFGKVMKETVRNELCIRLADNNYTKDYINLTREFLTCFE